MNHLFVEILFGLQKKNINGETSISRLSDKGLHKKISAYNAYKKGKLGGKPNIQNEV